MADVSVPNLKKSNLKRNLKILAGALPVVAVVAWYALTSAAFLKAVVIPRAAAKLGSEITLGDATVSPLSSVILLDLKLKPKGREQLLQAGRVVVRYKWRDIISGRISLDEATIESPEIQIIKDTNGVSNLDVLLASLKKEAKPKKEGKPKTEKPLDLNIHGVMLKNATVRYVINSVGGGAQRYEVHGVDISLDQLVSGQSSKLVIGAAMTVDHNPGAITNGSRGTLGALAAAKVDLSLDASLKPTSLKASVLLDITTATGDFRDAVTLHTALEADCTPTELRQLSLKFSRGPTPLGELRVSGPYDLSKQEGALRFEILGIDRQVLNLAGAAAHVDMMKTRLTSTNSVQLTAGGTKIALQGHLGAADASFKTTSGTTPVMDVNLDYNLSTDLGKKAVLINQLSFSASRGKTETLSLNLDKPMTFDLANTSGAVPESLLTLSLKAFDLADWKAFFGGVVESGKLTAETRVQVQAGNSVRTELKLNASDLTINAASNRVAGLAAQLNAVAVLKGWNALEQNWNTFEIEKADYDLTLKGASAVRGALGGKVELKSMDPNLTTTTFLNLPLLASLAPSTNIHVQSGGVMLIAGYSQHAGNTNLEGGVMITNLTAQASGLDFQNYNVRIQANSLITRQSCQIERIGFSLTPGGVSGGNIELSGQYDLAKGSGTVRYTVTGLNEAGLRPFTASALKPRQLKSVNFNSKGTASFSKSGAFGLKSDLSVTNLAMVQPTTETPLAPLSLNASTDLTFEKQILDLRQLVLHLGATARASNELTLQGRMDLNTNNTSPGNLSLKSDSLDLTPFIETFAGGSTNQATASNSGVADSGTSGSASNNEPAPLKLPLDQFTLTAQFGKVFLRDVLAANVSLVAKVDHNRVTLNPCKLMLNGAPVLATGAFDLSVPGYRYDFTFNASKVALGPLADSFSPTYRGQAVGDVNAMIDLHGAGVTGINLRKSLHGAILLGLTNANIQVVGPKLKNMLSPIAFVLGIQDLLRSPLDFVSTDVLIDGGQVEVKKVVAHSAAFVAEAKGTVMIAEVLTNSVINIPVDISLPRSLAQKFAMSGLTQNGEYLKLPAFARVAGTLGNPQTHTDKAVITGLLASGVAGQVGGKVGGFLQGFGGLLTGESGVKTNPAPTPPTAPAPTAPQTPPTTAPPEKKLNPLDLLNLLPKKK